MSEQVPSNRDNPTFFMSPNPLCNNGQRNLRHLALGTGEILAGPPCETGGPLIIYPPKEHDTPIAVEPVYRDDIESYLEGATEYQDQLRTVILHSKEATGKSTMAINYALSRHLRLGTPFILWVDCSDRISIKRSFNAIAQKLQLPGYDVRDHDTNRDLVVDWLEDTEFPWLIIYDNVSSFHMIEDYYPDETTDGRAIITTSCDSRDSLVGLNCLGLQIKPDSFIKICPFNKGLPLNAEMISHILKVHLPLGSNLGYSDAEKRNITSLCTGLGNNMQELLILGELLGSGLYSAETLCEYFANSMHAPRSIWSLAFESLTPRSRDLLTVLSPLNSTMGIHRDLFKVNSLPEDLAWCMDDTEWETSVKELSKLSLITSRKDKDTIGIPSSTQANLSKWLGEEGLMIGLERAAQLLHGIHQQHMFKNIGHLALEDYSLISYLFPHIRNLKDNFKAAREMFPTIKGSIQLCGLLVGYARYMLQEGFLSEVLDMIETHWVVFETLGSDQQASKWKDVDITGAYYLEWRVHTHRSNREKALECAAELSEYYCTISSQNISAFEEPDFVMALSYIATADYSSALEWFHKCNNLWRMKIDVPWGTNRGNLSLPPKMKAQEAWVHLLLDDMDAAKPLLESALEDIESEPTTQSELVDIPTVEFVRFQIAKLQIRERNFEDAKRNLLAALGLSTTYPLQKFSQSRATYMYYLAVCHMALGHVENARKYIEEATQITRLYQHDMPMEHARCLHLLVEISKRQPEMEESVTYEAKLSANKLIYKYLTTHDGTNLPEYSDSVSHHTRPTRVEIGLAQMDLEKAVEDNIFCFWR